MLDNGSDWKTTPPRFRKLVMFSSWVAIIALLFVVVLTGYRVSAPFAACYSTVAGAIGVMLGIYTNQRGKMDLMLTGEETVEHFDEWMKSKLPDVAYKKIKSLMDSEPESQESQEETKEGP